MASKLKCIERLLHASKPRRELLWVRENFLGKVTEVEESTLEFRISMF